MLPATAHPHGLRHIVICYYPHIHAIGEEYRVSSIPAERVPSFGIPCIPLEQMQNGEILKMRDLLDHFKTKNKYCTLNEALQSLIDQEIEPSKIELYCLNIIF